MASNAESSTLRIVHKTRYDEQTFIQAPHSNLGPLAPKSVRVQSSLIGLTANNLSYCALGTPLHWWDAFPVPSWAKTPTGDVSEYGIAPAWGYATILESNVESLQPGSLLWGYLPISSFPVDLLLTQSEGLSSHYIEVSEHRKLVMPLYQRYIAVSDNLGSASAAWKVVLKPVWEAGYLYNRYNFASEEGVPTFHPGFGRPWTEKDGDLKEALVVSLGAGSKTSRSFVHQLATNRTAGSGPLAVLEVSSSKSSPFTGRKLPFEHKATTYTDLKDPELSEWLFTRPVKRFVVLDFTGRAGISEQVHNLLETRPSGSQLDFLAVGSEARWRPAEEVIQQQQLIGKLEAVQCNASSIRDDALKAEGEEKYFSGVNNAFDKLLEQEIGPDGSKLGIKLIQRGGLQGSEGIQNTWDLLCRGQLKGDDGYAFRL